MQMVGWMVSTPPRLELRRHEGPFLRVAVLSPQTIVVYGLRAVIATMRNHLRFVHLDSSQPDPDDALYDAIGVVRGDMTDLDILLKREWGVSMGA